MTLLNNSTICTALALAFLLEKCPSSFAESTHKMHPKKEDEIGWVFEKDSIFLPNHGKLLRSEQRDANAALSTDAITSEDKAYFLSTTKWASPSIYVCWENPSNHDTEERLLVQA